MVSGSRTRRLRQSSVCVGTCDTYQSLSTNGISTELYFLTPSNTHFRDIISPSPHAHHVWPSISWHGQGARHYHNGDVRQQQRPSPCLTPEPQSTFSHLLQPCYRAQVHVTRGTCDRRPVEDSSLPAQLRLRPPQLEVMSPAAHIFDGPPPQTSRLRDDFANQPRCRCERTAA